MPEAIVVEDVSLAHPAGRGSVPVLAGVSLTVAPEEFVALVGPSGCGKSTLLDVVAGLAEPDAGTVRVAGGGARLGRAALMPQGDALLPWRTVAGNVALGAAAGGDAGDAGHGRVRAMIARLGLDGFADHYPHALSGGMRQRVALARTLLAGRPVWLLDEPFASLDALTRAEVHRDLARLWRAEGPAVLMVTHDTEEAVMLADRVLVCGHRPMGVLAEVPVVLPRPRRAADAAPARERVMEALGVVA